MTERPQYNVPFTTHHFKTRKGLNLCAFMLLFLHYATSINAQSLNLHYDHPARYFEEALVIGNGTMGGIVYGDSRLDRISLNDITLWTGEPDRKVYSPGAFNTIADIRKALDDEDYRRADQLQRRVQGHYSENYQPLGTLKIEYLDENGDADTLAITDYSRQLDLPTATATTTYKRGGRQFTAQYIASAPDSAIIIHLKADGYFSARISLDSQLPHTTYVQDNEIVSDGYVAYNSRPSYTDGGFSYDENRGIHYRTIVRVLADNRYYDEGETIRLRNNTDILIVICNVTSFNGFDKDPVAEGRGYTTLVRQRIEQASKRPWFDLWNRHVADFQTYFDRVRLDLGTTDKAIAALPTDRQLYDYTVDNQRNPELEALYFHYGRYLLISCSRTYGVPANLQGLWNEKMLPPWSCNYTSNINLEENYWLAETANLSEMHMPMLSFLSNLMQTGGITAHEYYGVDEGWCLAHNTDIWAMSCPVGEHSGDPVWACWNMGGAWTSTHIWEHYQFTHDIEFLRSYYPILRGAAQFCLAWLIEKEGYLMTSPSTSPENKYRTAGGYEGATLYGGTADVAMIRECITDTRLAAQTLAVDADLCNRIDATLKRLLPYRVGTNGNLQEWYHDWSDQDPQHRHQSHLFGLYPGHQIGADSPLAVACAKTLEIKGDNTTGWSTGWRVNLYARLHDSKNAYHIYRKLLSYISPDDYRGPNRRTGGGTYPNLLDAHSPFQIDGNFGGTAGVVEMLMQSTEESITLLPALPAEWADGCISGICARGGFVIDMTWKDGRVTSITISSKQGGQTTLFYNGTNKKIKIKANGTRTIKV